MKKIIAAAAAFVCLAVSPALAQSYDPDLGSGNLDSWPYTANPDNPYAAYSFAPYGAYGFDPSFGAYGFDRNYGTYAPVHRHHRRHGR